MIWLAYAWGVICTAYWVLRGWFYFRDRKPRCTCFVCKGDCECHACTTTMAHHAGAPCRWVFVQDLDRSTRPGSWKIVCGDCGRRAQKPRTWL